MPSTRSLRRVLVPEAARCLAVVALSGLAGSAVHADVIFVNVAQGLPLVQQTGESWELAFQSLTTALSAATSGDEIWVAEGTYFPTTDGNRNANFFLKPGCTVLGGFKEGMSSVDERDPEAFPCTLDGDIGNRGDSSDNSFHVVRATNANGAVLDGFTVRGGRADTPPETIGGGLRAVGTSSIFTVRNCLFIDNQSIVQGGAISSVGGLIVVDCRFEQNVSDVGGAIGAQTTGITVVNCLFSENHAESGGAIRLLNALGTNRIDQCVFTGNTAFNPGTSGFGGALIIENSPTELSHCTFAFNKADGSGALHIGLAGSVEVANSIFIKNEAGNGVEDIGGSGPTLVVSHCLIGAPFAGSSGNFEGDPAFVDPDGADNQEGTIDDDFALTRRSAAIDAAHSDFTPVDAADVDGDGDFLETLPNDFAGNPRSTNDVRLNTGSGSPAHNDIGAFEFDRSENILCVDGSSIRSFSGLSWDEPLNTLQAALALVNGFPFGEIVEIWVAEGTYLPATDGDRTLSFQLQANGKVFGGFAGFEGSRSDRNWKTNRTILSGAIGGPSTTDNSFHVVTALGDTIDANTLLDGFVVTGGAANGGSSQQYGGGIYISGAAPRIRNCVVVGNAAGVGAGIGMQFGASPAIEQCLISGNVAASSGGGVGIENSNPVIRSCTVVFNDAIVGGGLRTTGGSPALTTVVNSILFHNTADFELGQFPQASPGGFGSFILDTCRVQCSDGNFSVGDTNGLDPGLADVDGLDNTIGTVDDNAALAAGGGAIDAATTANLPDTDDLDEDGNVTETIPFDLLGALRVRNDTGMPNGLTLMDIGAAEFTANSPAQPVAGDLDGDGTVNGADLGILLSVWGTNDPSGDLDNDCDVDGADLGVLLAAWG